MSKESNRQWKADNPDKVIAGRIAYRLNHSDRILASSRGWQERNRDRCNESAKQWRADNPDKAREHSYRGKAKRKRLLVGAVQDDHTRTEILERDGWQCQLDDCRCPAGRAIDSNSTSIRWSATLDHRVPLSKGGDDTRDNVRAAHFACNSARGNR